MTFPLVALITHHITPHHSTVIHTTSHLIASTDILSSRSHGPPPSWFELELSLLSASLVVHGSHSPLEHLHTMMAWGSFAQAQSLCHNCRPDCQCPSKAIVPRRVCPQLHSFIVRASPKPPRLLFQDSVRPTAEPTKYAGFGQNFHESATKSGQTVIKMVCPGTNFGGHSPRMGTGRLK